MAASNIPERHTIYVLQEGERGQIILFIHLYTSINMYHRVEVIEDTKIPNAATFKVFKQDHTIANLLRSYLHENKSVIFAGYKVPHPLEPYFILKVQTNGSLTPTDAVKQAAQSVIMTVSTLQKKFEDQFRDKEYDIGMDDAVGAGAGGAKAGVQNFAYNDAYADF